MKWDEARLPPYPCENFEKFSAGLRGEVCDFSLLLLFLNAPASAFGHTLLRINKDATAKSGKRFELLDQGINFAAVMTTQNPVIYAVKGVFGFSRHVYERPLLLQGA